MTGKRPRVSAVRLDQLIAEATVDCYNEEEQLTGLFTLIEDASGYLSRRTCWACQSPWRAWI
jgi:hypothetical protein